MRSTLAILLLGLVLCGDTTASQYSFTYLNGNQIPDGNPVGLTDTRIVSGLPSGLVITNIELTLNISGGYNGDLYGHLLLESGNNIGFAVLLNRVGRNSNNPGDGQLYFGYPDTGFSVTFSDYAATDIHIYQSVTYQTNASGQLLGTWQPDGRTTSPYNVLVSDPRSAFLSSFVGLDPNGEWTLFLADCSSGETAVLQSWGLNIMTVPEPGPTTLVVLGALAGAVGIPSVRNRLISKLRNVSTKAKS